MRRIAAVLAVLLAACGGGDDAARYEVTLDVAYEEELRVPGVGYVLHELQLEYVLGAVTEPGVTVEAEPAGTAAWTIRCYETPFGPDQQPFAEFSGTHPAIFDWERGDLRNADRLEGGVDWTSVPAILVLDDGDRLRVVHRLPSALAADRAISCQPDQRYTGVALEHGDAALRAPGRVNTPDGDLTRAEALNAGGTEIYVDGDAGSGWVLYDEPASTVTEELAAFTWGWENNEPEGTERIDVVGSIRRVPAEG